MLFHADEGVIAEGDRTTGMIPSVGEPAMTCFVTPSSLPAVQHHDADHCVAANKLAVPKQTAKMLCWKRRVRSCSSKERH